MTHFLERLEYDRWKYDRWMEIRLLSEADTPAWRALRLEALQGEPFAFGSAAEDFQALGPEGAAARFRSLLSQGFLVGAFAGGGLGGMAAFHREQGTKERHKGSIYSVYVRPALRGKGIGRAMLACLADKAREDPSLEQISLAVATSRERRQ